MQTIYFSPIAVIPFQAAAITLHTGHEVFKLLAEESFQQDWDTLCRECSWATVFQSRLFVTTWYEVYKEKYLPIVVKRMEGGKLTGLLTLAKHHNTGNTVSGNKKGRILGAGHFEAEYQTWLSEASDSETFIKAALLKIRDQFPAHDILFRYITPTTPLDWISSEVQWKQRCVMQSFSRPLMEMNDPGISKMFHKTEYRNKLNRLKRLGTLRFEHITDQAQFADLLKDLVIQYDFRQGAMFNKNNFREEPLKADFLLALFEKDLLHVTALKVNEEIMASIVAIKGTDWVYLGGVNIHTPFNAKFYSPGFVNFILLAQLLLKEGVAVFDLTPGGDFYKERMATKHDQVIELVITDDPVLRIKRQLRKRVHSHLIRSGKWPMGVEVALKKRLYIFKARMKMMKSGSGLKLLADKIRQQSVSKHLAICRFASQTSGSLIPINVKRNSLDDLLDFTGEGTWMTRWEFLENAMRRFEVGGHCYSWSEQGVLQACVWLGSDHNLAAKGQQSSVLKTDVSPLQEVYCHPGAREQLPAFLAAVTAQVTREKEQDPVYAAVPSYNKNLCQILQDIGFQKAI